jgi:hypothetical protein
MRRDCAASITGRKAAGFSLERESHYHVDKTRRENYRTGSSFQTSWKKTDRTAVNRRGDRDCSRAFNDYIRKEK